MEHIAVSVIVPIYNAEPWLEECVQSILDQDFPASYGTIEVLLIDDGATDGSGALCDRLAKRDNRIKVVHQENQGLSGARNTGIDMARGRYYAFIDSDDVVRPAYLKKMYEACEAHDAYMAICAVEDVQENGKPLPEPVFTPPTQEGVFRGKDLLNDFYAPNGTYYTVAWNKLYRAEVWKLLHYPEGRLHEDDFVAHRLFWRCDKVVCLPDVLYYDLKYPDQVNNFLALPTKEESDKINALLPNLQTASKELATKLTLGQISVDDLDKEVEKLEELGLSELVDIYQARYERYLANMPS